MGQKVNPLGFRIGISERWRSRWNGTKKEIPRLIKEDQIIRKHLKKAYFFAGIPRIEIERTGETTTVIVHTARPGILIGRKGKKLEEIQAEIEKLLAGSGRKVRLTVSEVGRPELDGQLVAESIREQLEKRQAFRRVLKKAIQTTANAGAKGVRVKLSGRLGGAELSRCEHQSHGSIPLTTLAADVNYGFTEAYTSTGHIGIKVWVYRGRYDDPKPRSSGVGELRPRRAPTRLDAPSE
jgi:small subunit ribosomal protein S3